MIKLNLLANIGYLLIAYGRDDKKKTDTLSQLAPIILRLAHFQRAIINYHAFFAFTYLLTSWGSRWQLITICIFNLIKSDPKKMLKTKRSSLNYLNRTTDFWSINKQVIFSKWWSQVKDAKTCLIIYNFRPTWIYKN